MKIGILGAGHVGSNLGRAFAARGHEIVFGVRDPQKITPLLKEIGAKAGGIAEAVAFGQVVAQTIPWGGVEEAVKQGGDWTGKIVIDATNRFPSGGANSAAEDLAKILPDAKVVKAFNTIGAEHYLNPVFDGMAASMFICGDDESAKQVVGQLAAELGFDLVDVGGLSNARLLEPLAQLWVTLMRTPMGRDIAFRLLKK